MTEAERHKRREAKAARRRRRVGTCTRGKVRGPMTRALGMVDLAHAGETKVFKVSASVGRYLKSRGVRTKKKRDDD